MPLAEGVCEAHVNEHPSGLACFVHHELRVNDQVTAAGGSEGLTGEAHSHHYKHNKASLYVSPFHIILLIL